MTNKSSSAKPSRQTPTECSFDCLAFEQSTRTLCVFACSAKQLWNLSQVNQREEDADSGYQRAVSAARVTKIADFIDAGNPIPTSVLVSFSHARISPDRSKLIVENRKDAGWVIDGQHRLAGASKATNDIVLPVVAFIDLKVEEQVQCFVTINREQRGVSSSLYLELLKNLPGKPNPNEDAKSRAVDLAHLLKHDEESPFYGKIVSTTSPRPGELSLTNFVRKVQPMTKASTGCLITYNDDERCKILNAYYKALQQVFPSEYNSSNSVFFKTIGFGVLMGVFPQFLLLTIQASNGFRVAHAVSTFQKIEDFDFAHWKRMTGSGAESALADDLRQTLIARMKDSGASANIVLD